MYGSTESSFTPKNTLKKYTRDNVEFLNCKSLCFLGHSYRGHLVTDHLHLTIIKSEIQETSTQRLLWNCHTSISDVHKKHVSWRKYIFSSFKNILNINSQAWHQYVRIPLTTVTINYQKKHLRSQTFTQPTSTWPFRHIIVPSEQTFCLALNETPGKCTCAAS